MPRLGENPRRTDEPCQSPSEKKYYGLPIVVCNHLLPLALSFPPKRPKEIDIMDLRLSFIHITSSLSTHRLNGHAGAMKRKRKQRVLPTIPLELRTKHGLRQAERVPNVQVHCNVSVGCTYKPSTAHTSRRNSDVTRIGYELTVLVMNPNPTAYSKEKDIFTGWSVGRRKKRSSRNCKRAPTVSYLVSNQLPALVLLYVGTCNRK